MNFHSTWVRPTGNAIVHPSRLTAHLKVKDQDRSKYPKGLKFTGETGWTEQGRKWARARFARYLKAHQHEGVNSAQIIADAPRHIREKRAA